MPIRIVDSKHGSRPAFFCDACGEEIKRADDGNYHWRWRDEEARGGAHPYFSHKRCCLAVDRAEKTSSAMGLDDFLFFLTHNTKCDLKKAKAKALMFQCLGW
jgi:hypothetical protein